MKPSTEIWPPPPMRPHLAADTNDDNWLIANDLLWEITWRDSAIVARVGLSRKLCTSSTLFCHKETLMRQLSTALLASFALTAGTMLATLPASAQQAAPPVVSSAPVSELAPLPIPAPPGGKLRVEMDARSEDLLGMVKSFLKGIGETGAPTVLLPGQTAASASAQNPVAQAIANGDLAAMLKDVNHVHVVVYEVAGPPMPAPVMTAPGKPGAPKPAPAAPVMPSMPAVPAFDSNSFYETAFASEGAHRILYTDADAYKLVMVGFPNRQGFAFAASGGGYVIVERSDGYPDLEVLTAFISHVTTAVANSQMGKKMLNSTFDSSHLALPETKMLLNK